MKERTGLLGGSLGEEGRDAGGAGTIGMSGPCRNDAVALQLTQRGRGGTMPIQRNGEHTAPPQSEQVPMTTT